MSETKFTFTWHIENYFLWGGEKDCYIESPVFVDSVFKNRWCLVVFPRGTRTCVGYCSAYLVRLSKDELIETVCKLEIVKNNKDIVTYKTVKHTFTVKNCSKYFPKLIKTDELAEKFASDDVLTVRCHLMTEKPYKDQCVTGCIARTRIGVDKFSFHWNVESSNQLDDWSETKTFPFLKSSSVESSWKFMADVIHFRIKKVNDDLYSRFLLCQLTLLDKRKQKFYSQKKSFLFTSENNCWEFSSFITKNFLKDNEGTLLHKNNCIMMQCDLTVSNDNRSESIERYIVPNTSVDSSTAFTGNDDVLPSLSSDLGNTCVDSSTAFTGNDDVLPSLSSDLGELFIDKKHTDIELRVDDTVIPAHKCILAARSPVFSAMFNSDMVENQSGTVEIDDIDFGTLRDLVKFLYTDAVDIKRETAALKLLMASDKYQVLTLRAKCSVFLKSNLSQDNVCETLAAADLTGCADLRNAAIDYIKTNAGSILGTEKWLKWISANVQLGSEIFRQMSVEVANASKFNQK